MASSNEHFFKARIASRGYHVFKETTCKIVKGGDSVRAYLETNKLSKKFDAYTCVIRVKN